MPFTAKRAIFWSMSTIPDHFARAINAAEIWRDPAVSPADRRRARKRFDYALAKLAPDVLRRIHLHLFVVAAADVTITERSA